MKRKYNLTVVCRDRQVSEIDSTKSPFVSPESFHGILCLGLQESSAAHMVYVCVCVCVVSSRKTSLGLERWFGG